MPTIIFYFTKLGKLCSKGRVYIRDLSWTFRLSQRKALRDQLQI